MEFIVNKHNYAQFVSDVAFSADSLGNKLYVALQPKGTTLLKIHVFSDNSGGQPSATSLRRPETAISFRRLRRKAAVSSLRSLVRTRTLTSCKCN